MTNPQELIEKIEDYLSHFQHFFDLPLTSPSGHEDALILLKESISALPQWVAVEDELPKESGLYIAGSTSKERARMCEVLSGWQGRLYAFDAEAGAGKSKWQHVSGFYDNGITHWLPWEQLPTPPDNKE